jgi:HPt (histidine-containing phosphotransfer) domain-containing protein
MDVQMPEMDGLEATRRIRGPRSPVKDHQVPIIALTAHAMQSDRERCLAAGMNDYVAKPIIPQALAEALERWLPRRALRREEVPARARELPPGPRVKPPPPVFDREGMMARLVHDEGLAHTVVTAFMADVPRRIQALKDHLDAGDAKGLERQAHTIKGASANLCCEALRAAAAELEGAGKAGSMDAARTLVPGLESQFAQLQAAMGQHFQIPGSG